MYPTKIKEVYDPSAGMVKCEMETGQVINGKYIGPNGEGNILVEVDWDFYMAFHPSKVYIK